MECWCSGARQTGSGENGTELQSKDVNVTKHKYLLRVNPYPEAYSPPFPTNIVGTFSNHGIQAGDSADKGVVVKINQDRGSVNYPFMGDRMKVLFCCLDGHGSNGERVSEFAIREIQTMLEAALGRTDKGSGCMPCMPQKPKTVGEMLQATFVNTDINLKQSNIPSNTSGSTAVSVYYERIGPQPVLHVAFVGDSRAVLGRREGDSVTAVALTDDHKPNRPDEKQRIEQAGGMVSTPEEEGLAARVWTNTLGHITGGLAVSRAIGDHALRKAGVIATPEIHREEMQEDNDEILILASDGVWEHMSNQDVINIAAQYDNATDAAYHIVCESTRLWWVDEGEYRDDITVIVIFLKDMLEYMKECEEAPLYNPSKHAYEVKQSTRASMAMGDIDTAMAEHMFPGQTKGGDGDFEQFRRRRLTIGGDYDPTGEEAGPDDEAAPIDGLDSLSAELANDDSSITLSPDMDFTLNNPVPTSMDAVDVDKMEGGAASRKATTGIVES